MSSILAKPAAPDAFDAVASIAPELRPLPISPERGALLRRSLIERVRRSALAHRDLTTVRREDGAWTATSPGVRQRALSAVGGMGIFLLQVEPQAAIPWPQDAQAQELLVIDGTLEVHAEGSPPVGLPALNQLVIGRAAAVRLAAGSSGVILYVRRRTVDLESLPADEARWWIAAEGAPLPAAPQASPWAGFLAGVEAAVLRAHGDVASMLLRIAPGATLPDHGHALDEDCFMIEGHMFLGDILMRAGDYQWAPVGCQHVGISSDTGGLFYFHGAVPPAASGPER